MNSNRMNNYERTNIIKKFNEYMGNPPKPYIKLNYNKPVNLKKHHLENMNILNYIISPKLDGTRRMCFIFDRKVYLINYGELSFISSINTDETYIFDTELLNNRIYIFDCVMSDHLNIMNMNKNERYKYVEQFMNRKYCIKNMTFDIIPQYSGNLHEMFKTIHKKYKDIDGVIFYPSDLPYHNEKTYKYKPSVLLTIDFLVQNNDNKMNLMCSTKDHRLEVFSGNEHKKFILENCEHEFVNYMNKIVECNWDGSKFVVLRVRTDRDVPNNIVVANDIWDDIHCPLSFNCVHQILENTFLISKLQSMVFK